MQPETITTETLQKAARLLNVKALATAAGVSVDTLHARLRRGTPTPEAEAARIMGAMKEAGIMLVV